MYILRIILLLVVTITIGNCALAAGQLEKNADIFKNIISDIGKKNYAQAQSRADNATDPVIKDLYNWLKMRDNNQEKQFGDVTEFIATHPTWPDLNTLQINAENNMRDMEKDEAVITWFNKRYPQTAKGKYYFIQALMNKNRSDRADHRIIKIIEDTWVNDGFDSELEAKFVRDYGSYISHKAHQDKIDKLLWKGDYKKAEYYLSFLDDSLYNIYKKQLSLAQNPEEEMPNMSWPFLDFIKAKYYGDKEKDPVKSANLLLKIPSDLIYEDIVWKYKKIQIRELLNNNQFQLALRLAKSYKGSNVTEISESHWLCGWINYEFLQNYTPATHDFSEFYQVVKQPISKSRGAYWLAITFDKLGKEQERSYWLQKASKFPATFYGQIALTKLNKHVDFKMPASPKPTKEDERVFANNELARSAYYLINAGLKDHAKKFIVAAVNGSKTPGEASMIAKIGDVFDMPNIGVWAAKTADSKHFLLTQYAYPIVSGLQNAEAENSFLLALARQESEFDPTAISHKGAMGLMQVMPETAKRLAKEKQMSYEQTSLLKPAYNILLGSHYIRKLLNQFDDSYILTAASYNAGENKVALWIEKYGDPRKLKTIDEVVTWIESIPYYETRNYVQRVLENTQIYRHILKEREGIALVDDLVRG